MGLYTGDKGLPGFQTTIQGGLSGTTAGPAKLIWRRKWLWDKFQSSELIMFAMFVVRRTSRTSQTEAVGEDVHDWNPDTYNGTHWLRRCLERSTRTSVALG